MPRIKSRAVFIDPIIMSDLVELLEEDAPEKACISCVHNIRIHDKDHPLLVTECRCDVDNHYIGYCQNWICTCKYHSLEKELQ